MARNIVCVSRVKPVIIFPATEWYERSLNIVLETRTRFVARGTSFYGPSCYPFCGTYVTHATVVHFVAHFADRTILRPPVVAHDVPFQRR